MATITIPLSIIRTAEQRAAEATAAAWAALRAERSRRLAACDWTQLPDAPVADAEAWAAYRQALRDLPDLTTDPTAPDWPVEPA